MRRLPGIAFALVLSLVALAPPQAAAQSRALLPPAGGPIVLVYHAIGPQRRFWVTPDQLKRDIKFLRDQGYHFVTLKAFAAYEEFGAPLPRRAVLLTLDDGAASVYRYALPLTRRLHIPAVAFIIGRRLGLPGYMTRQEVSELYLSGLWSIEAHTYDMHSYRHGQLGYAADLVNPKLGETAAGFAQEIEKDVQMEAATFKAMDLPPPTAFAFPFGMYGPEAVSVLHKSYALLFDSTPQLAAPHEIVIGRIDATGDPLGVILAHYLPRR